MGCFSGVSLRAHISVITLAFTKVIRPTFRVKSFILRLKSDGFKGGSLSLTLWCCNKMLCFLGTLGPCGEHPWAPEDYSVIEASQ